MLMNILELRLKLNRQADIVKYRDKVSGKLVEARVPTAVLALLKLRASCSGKPVSDQKLARMAVDVPLGLKMMQNNN